MRTKFACLLLFSLLTVTGLCAKENIPRGYEPIANLEKAKAEAIAKNRLLVIMVKGRNDACPYCADALTNGEGAIGAGVVKVFARAEALNTADGSDYPSALQARVRRKFTTGASLTVLVFNPDMSQLLVESNRKELQSDRKSIAAFKSAVTDHKRQLN